MTVQRRLYRDTGSITSCGMSESAPIPVLTIAGSDPGGGAGVQADLRVFSWMGLYGLSAITALTSQNTQTVKNIYPAAPLQVSDQLTTILDDVTPKASKTGMLAGAGIVEEVAAVLSRMDAGPLVVDPVLASTTGDSLGDPEIPGAIVRLLLPLCRVVTPNLSEAASLTGRTVETLADAIEAARALVDLGADAACVTGGHLSGAPTDVLFYEGSVEILEGNRQGKAELHGTGCFFSAALTGLLAQSVGLVEAVACSKELLESAAAGAISMGNGLQIPWLGHPA